MSNLKLYQSETCPFCKKVREFCTKNGISVLLHNPRTASGKVTDKERYEELKEYGQDQVPLLVDDGRDVVMYESDDIVDYLQEHYA